jgi:hypothetical protein
MPTVQTTVPAMWPQGCDCQWSDRTNHDVLLRLEADFDIAAALVTFITCHDASEPEGEVAPCDLPDFVAEHNWRNPAAVRTFARDLLWLYQRGSRDIDEPARRALDKLHRDGCDCDMRLTTEEHEWLLTIERDGLRGAVDLISELEERADCDSEPGKVSYLDIVDFVGKHPWRDPEAMFRLARHVERFIGDRRDHSRRADGGQQQ